MILAQLEFGSLLSYCSQKFSTRPDVIHSKDIMLKLKNGGFIGQPPVEMAKWVAQEIHQSFPSLPFSPFFRDNPILVPVPRSSPMQKGTLWVPGKIAQNLLSLGIGASVVPMLERVKAVPKSAWSPASERASPSLHYDSMAVQKQLAAPKMVVLVDDVVTRGHILIAGASLIHDAYPNCEIKGFAAMRTISYESSFVKEYEPVIGSITYRPVLDDCIRRP